VRGDIVLLSEGDRVPADAVVLTSVSLTVDESILTGESVSMRKAAADGVPGAMARPGGDELPFVYSGTLIVQGRGIARVRLQPAEERNWGELEKRLRPRTQRRLLCKEERAGWFVSLPSWVSLCV
jgi:Ca2+-transporting ATPase